MGVLVQVPGQGNLSIAPAANAPLLVVFGGIDAHKLHSGVYMWNYMNPLGQRFHIFVALSNQVNGTLAYDALMKTVTDKGLNPSRQVLYLFSGGYKPGIDLLRGGPSASKRSTWSTSGWGAPWSGASTPRSQITTH